MSDLISRQYILDKFKAMCDACGEGEKYNGVMCRCCALDDGICIVEDAPATESERKWIPVSEKLPGYGDIVIVTVLDESGDTPYRYTESGFYVTDGLCWIVDNEIRQDVIAWMPLPEPYRGKE